MQGPELDQVAFDSAEHLSAMIREREISSSELVDLYLRRVDRLNPDINAIVTLCEESARLEGRRVDDLVAKGKPLGPLAGLPFTVKDLIATAGVRTTAGSLTLSDFVPRETAPAIERLRAAGAILLGKSNCPEFGLDIHTSNRLFGDTWNPWNTQMTSGGSSGGDSAAVAAGMATFGVGTDYGGSIRWPAHCTGLVALRPTPGLVPSTGQLPYPPAPDFPPPNSASLQYQLQTIAPLARSVRDLWSVASVMAGPDNRDFHSVPVSLNDPADVDLSRLSCTWFDGDGTVPVRADIVDVVQAAARALEVRGVLTTNLRPPRLEFAEDVFAALRAADGMADHLAVATGREDQLTWYVREWLEGSKAQVSVEEYQRLTAAADSIRVSVLHFMETWPILLLPVASIPAFEPGPHDFVVEGTTVKRFNIETCCRVITLLRAPSAVVPCGTSRDGLPVGVQIVGRPFRDDQVIAVALALESQFGPWRPAMANPLEA
jgi:Asp-tRNA(Asn)/Glu-tRNA(Gln) amidotransferase A subunit family amidase